MALDVRTLYFVLVLVYGLFGCFQLGMWRVRPQETALLLLGCSNLVTTLGNLLLSLRGEIPDVISIGGANTLLFLGYGLLWAGLRRFQDQPVLWWIVWISPLLLGGLYAFYEPVAQDLTARVLIQSFAIAIFFMACLYDGHRAQKTDYLVMRKIAMVVCMLGLGFVALRLAVNAEISVGSYLEPGRSKSLLVALTLVIVLLLNLAVIFMVSERQEHRLTRLAHSDALTSLLNRRGFRELALRQLGRSLRDRQPVCVLVMDLDHFKRINDEHGHDAGDELLNRFAETTRSAIRPTDLLARYGGEEFCALLPNSTLGDAETVAGRIRRTFETQYILRSDVQINTTVSIGVAQIQMPQEGIDGAIDRADRALFDAKRQGRNRVVLAQTDPAVVSPDSVTAG